MTMICGPDLSYVMCTVLIIPSRRAGSSFVRQWKLFSLTCISPHLRGQLIHNGGSWSDLQALAPASVIHRNHPASYIHYVGVLHQTFGPVPRGDYRIAFHNDAVDNGNIGRTTRRVASRSAVFSAASKAALPLTPSPGCLVF